MIKQILMSYKNVQRHFIQEHFSLITFIKDNQEHTEINKITVHDIVLFLC